jgi:hypothetical protein
MQFTRTAHAVLFQAVAAACFALALDNANFSHPACAAFVTDAGAHPNPFPID